MVLSKRERYVFLGTLIAVGALALDRFALSPLLDQRSATKTQSASLARQLARAQGLMEHRDRAAPKWREMIQAGMKNDPAEARSQVLHAVRNWAEASGVALSLLKPERLTEKKQLPEIVFQASGTGTLSAVAKLLWRMQTATIPVKITEMQIGARKEGMDNLSFQLRISTVYAPGPSAPAAAARVRSGAPGGY